MGQLSRRSFALVAGGAVAALGGGRAFAAAAAFDPTLFVNPELRPVFVRLQKMFALRPLTDETLAAERKASLSLSPPPRAAPGWSERTIPGPRGAPDVRIYVINAGKPGGPSRPAILQIHGGGFVMGTAKQALSSNQELAAALDCVVVSVDYRLAPETPFPGALEDNYAALKWLYQHAEELGVDRARIALLGESAGGGHAAMLAIAARDRGEVPLAYQALVYPMLDDRTGSTRKKPPYMGFVIWDEQRNRFGWTSLLGAPAGSRKVPAGSVPARVENLKGLPPAFIGVGSVDLFVDEDVEYARRLIDAGVPVRLNVVPGAFHGFDALPSALAQDFKADLVSSLRTALRAKA
ncbi:alpha/beta hydrolase [Phenylobacterium sp. LjRoot219]|uniref:alpha/beta hydrolase n=1 Tax=Phenylobacterium sp. LjRoot219 TaxID=3342283 RepID=UPI003ECF9C04